MKLFKLLLFLDIENWVWLLIHIIKYFVFAHCYKFYLNFVLAQSNKLAAEAEVQHDYMTATTGNCLLIVIV